MADSNFDTDDYMSMTIAYNRKKSLMDIEKQLVQANEELAELYRGKSTDTVLINQYWNRIEALYRLQSDLD